MNTCSCHIRRPSGERVLDYERIAKLALPGALVEGVMKVGPSIMVVCDWGRIPFDELETGVKRLMRDNHYSNWDLTPSSVVLVR